LKIKDKSIYLSKGPVTLTFDRKIKPINDFVTEVEMNKLMHDVIYDALINTITCETHEINHLHKIFGHIGLETLKNTAKMYG
jgi:hypothetical protein